MAENEIYRYDIIIDVNDDEAVRRAQAAEERLRKIFDKIERQTNALSKMEIIPSIRLEDNITSKAQAIDKKLKKLDGVMAKPEVTLVDNLSHKEQLVEKKLGKLDKTVAEPKALLEDRGINERISRTTSKLRDLTSRAWRVSLSVKDEASTVLHRVAGALTSPMTMLGVGVGGAAAIGMPLKFAGEMEQVQLAMDFFTESPEKGKKFMDELINFAAKTPFEFPFVRESATGLVGAYKGMGMDVDKATKQTMRSVTAFGDAAGYTGAGEAGMKMALLGYRQIGTIGKLQLEELRQVTENLLIPMELVRKELGLTKEQMADVGKLNIPAERAMEAITRALEKNFGGGMEKLSKTLLGLVSTVKDTARFTVGAFGAGMAEPVKRILVDIVGTTDYTSDKFKAFMKKLEDAGTSVGEYFEKSYHKAKKFFEQLSMDDDFQNMDWGDKIVYVLDKMMQAIDKWVSGSDGKQAEKIFIKLAEIATRAWLTAIGGMVKGSVDALMSGNITGAAGLTAGAALLGGGLLLRGGLGVGKAILKGGKWVASRGISRDIATVMDAIGTTPAKTPTRLTERILNTGKAVQKVESDTVKATSIAAHVPIGYKPADKRFWENIDLTKVESRDKVVSLQNTGRLQRHNDLEKVFGGLPENKPRVLERFKGYGQKAVQYAGLGRDAVLIKAGTLRERFSAFRQAMPVFGRDISAKLQPGQDVVSKMVPATTEAVSNGSKASKVLAKVSKVAGKAAWPIALATEAIGIYKADDKVKATAQAGGGLAGAWAGGAAGAKIGAAIGTVIAPGVGTAIGGVLGSIVGSIGGYATGKWAAGKMVEKPVTAEASERLAKAGKAASDQQERIAQTGRVYLNSQGDIITSNGFIINSQNDLMQAFTTLAQAVDFASAKLIAFSGIELQVPTVGVVSNDTSSPESKRMRYTMADFTAHATGGILTRPHLGLVAEAGPEAIIPLNPARRAQALNLWQQTGKMLGVQMHADGGFFGAFKRFFGNDKVQSIGNIAEQVAISLESTRKGYEKTIGSSYSKYEKKLQRATTIDEAVKARDIAHKTKNLARGFGGTTKIFSRVALPIAIFASAAEIMSADDKKRAIVKELGATLGAMGAGALAGAGAGALVGAGVLSPLTAMVGAIIGAGAGAIGGQTIADKLYGRFAKYATGGILTRPHLGMVAEDGPEVIIPLSQVRRKRALDLWQKAGEYLGVRPYAFGGFAGLTPIPAPVPSPANVGGGINVTVAGINVNLAYNELDEEAVALRIGWRVLNEVKKALENRA